MGASVIERLLEDGMSRGNVTIWVARTLAAVKVDDPQWGGCCARSVIAHVIQDATLLPGGDSAESSRMGALLSDVARTIGNFMQAITTLSTVSRGEKIIFSKIAAVQIVAETIENTMQSGAALGNISDAVARTTGAQLTKSIIAAATRVEDVNGDEKSDALRPPPSSGGCTGNPTVTMHYLPTNATSFSGTGANDSLSISTSASWTPLVMTAVVLDGGAGNNTLSVQDDSNIAAASISNFRNLIFDATGHAGLKTVSMNAAQNQPFTGTITALGTGINGEEITIVGDGGVTKLANVKNYKTGDDSTNARSVTMTNASGICDQCVRD